MKHQISSYNKYACLKANDIMIIIGLYLLKPYIIAAASFTFRKDRSAIMNIFYTDQRIISFEAAAAIPLLFLIYAWTRRTPTASKLVRKTWKNGKELIIATAFLQLCVTSFSLWFLSENSMTRFNWLQLFLYTLAIFSAYFSTYMRDCFDDFPEEIKKGEK